MKECEKCKYLRRCSGKLVCGSSSSDNYDQYIELIDMCDVFGFNEQLDKQDDMQMPFQVEDDSVNHPAHYTNRQHECIDEMLAVFGKKAVINFCICNCWKYRYRAGSKGPAEEDQAKSDWYMNKAMELIKGEEAYDSY